MPPSFITVLGAAEGGIVFAIVMIISVISWLVNLIKESQAKSKPTKRTRPVDQGPSELEIFMQQVSGKAPPEKPRPVQERPSQQRPNQQRPNQKRPGQQRPGQQKPGRSAADNKGGKPRGQQQPQPETSRPLVADRPGARLAQTHLASAGLGDNIRNHVSSNMDARSVENQVKQDVDNAVQRDISDSVQRNIGVDGTFANVQRQTVHPLILALRNPDGVRQALLMSEILKRPRSIRL